MQQLVVKQSRGKEVMWYAIGGVVALGIVTYAVSQVRSGIRNTAKAMEDKEQIRKTNQEVNKHRLTLSESEYQQLANNMFKSMDYRVGTSSAVLQAFTAVGQSINQLKTLDDWKRLIVVFDRRKSTMHWFKDFEGTLPQWIIYKFEDLPKGVETLRKMLRVKLGATL